MSDYLQQKHNFLGSKIGSEDFYGSLPNQTLSKSKKTRESFEIPMMDRLEQIGIQQVIKNLSLREYRKMYEGRLVHQDFADTAEITQSIADFGVDKVQVPSYIKHYDIIGLIVNQLAGEFDNQKDTIRVDSIDPFSDSEFFREKNTQIRQFVKQYFEAELKKGLIMQGINPEGQEFENEEQQQQYLQMVEEEKAKIKKPSEIEKELSKDFKTVITEWAELTLEQDFIRFDMQDMDMEELVDYLLTGRYFRHYHVGHDYYKPERWSPEQTFFSEELDILYPQDAEFIGKIHFLSASQVLTRYGEKLTKKEQESLYEYDVKGGQQSILGKREGINGMFGTESHIVPYQGYYQRQTAHSFQEGLGIPMGKQYKLNEKGEQESRYSWLDSSQNYGHANKRIAKYLRDDVEVRRDLMQVTEAYWVGQKLVGLLTLENEITEEPYQVTVDETLLKDYIKENNIKKLTKVTREEAEKNPEEHINTIAWFFIPEVWQGKKINAGSTRLENDIYFDIKPMDNQIKGNSDDYSPQLPVAGIVTSGLGPKIRTYQVKYNLVMNLIENFLEKHIGSFMMFDFNFLASQYKDDESGDIAEGIAKWRDTIRETGLGTYDASPANTGNLSPQAAAPQMMRISFIEDIQQLIPLAEKYKQLAYEQIGITPQRAGTPSQYMNTEGVKAGQTASYAQTERIYKRFNTAKRKEREIHLSIAQHAIKDNKDIKVSYTRPDGARILKKFTDEDFWLRKVGITPVDDSTQRKKLQEFRTFMMQNNTMQSDTLAYAKLFTSDSFVSLMDHAEYERSRADKQRSQQQQHEQSMVEKQIQAQKEEKATELAHEAEQNQKDRENLLRGKELDAIGRMGDDNAEQKYFDRLEKETDRNIKEEQGNKKIELQEKEFMRKEEEGSNAFQLRLKELQLKADKIKADKEKNQNDLTIALVNKN